MWVVVLLFLALKPHLFFFRGMLLPFQAPLQLSAPLNRSGLGTSRARTFQVIGK
jgi:hypothetical protein